MPTNISFVDETWNPWQGCSKISAGCTNCYMYREKKRYGHNPAVVIRSADATFYRPLKYHSGIKVFTCSWSDFFIEEADAWRDGAWRIIELRQDVLFVIITKRTFRVKECLPVNWAAGYPNVILGFTAEDQGWFDRRWKEIRQIPAAGYLCMHEPALGQIIYSNDFLTLGQRSWVIAGGETGPDARPAHANWFRLDRDQCSVYKTPFFFKQWGEWEWWNPDRQLIAEYKDLYKWPDNTVSVRTGSRYSGHFLDCKVYNDSPVIYLSAEEQLSLSL